MRHLASCAVLAVLAISLAGCQSLREAAGMEKIEPDEFAISTKAPLVIPPDYNLRPPAPGAPPTNSLDPTQTAEAAITGQAAPITGLHGQLSVAEQELLTKAGAGDASNAIRQRIAADNRNMQTADQSFTNQLLFGLGGPANNADSPINPVAEKGRLDAKGETGVVRKEKPMPADTINKTKPDDNGGWLGGVFDGIF